MDQTDFFRVISRAGRVLHIQLKGFIEDEMVDAIQGPILEEFTRAIETFGKDPWIILVDMTEFRPTSTKGQNLVAAMMKQAHAHALYHSVEVIPSALTRLTLASTSSRAKHDAFRTVVESMEQARKAVEEALERMRSHPPRD